MFFTDELLTWSSVAVIRGNGRHVARGQREWFGQHDTLARAGVTSRNGDSGRTDISCISMLSTNCDGTDREEAPRRTLVPPPLPAESA